MAVIDLVLEFWCLDSRGPHVYVIYVVGIGMPAMLKLNSDGIT